MTLQPIDEAHALQIQAGVLGRVAGHQFEDTITQRINESSFPFRVINPRVGHVFTGNPAASLLHYIGTRESMQNITKALAISTGALATSEAGKQWLTVNGLPVYRCKSDLIITLSDNDGRDITICVSTKQSNNRTPTNAQLFFTTARGFSNLLKSNGIPVSENAIRALRQFCGDVGFRPSDVIPRVKGRLTDSRRYFWEEIETDGRKEWQYSFETHQEKVSRLLLQKAYLDDPFVPEYLLHKTKFAEAWEDTEVAIYSIDEIVSLSVQYQGFVTKPYTIKKGSYKDPEGVSHLAPRFGIIQMQRGGQKQHPEQLQFNLESGYFYKI